MGCCPSSLESAGTKWALPALKPGLSSPISKTEVDGSIKLLFLGPAECGKSTFLKQLRLIHTSGFSDSERHSYVPKIRRYIISSICTFGDKAVALNEELEADLSIVKKNNGSIWDEDDAEYEIGLVRVGGAVVRLWANASFRQAYDDHCAANPGFESFAFFGDRSAAIFAADFAPSDEDILRCRVKTSGVVTQSFSYSGMNFELYDVCGQKSERKKWIHCFEDVDVVLFVAALSDYDVNLRMRDSVELFDQIINNRWFEDSTVILFLNKTDVFKNKLINCPFGECFPDYNGPETFECTSQFLLKKFEAANKDPTKRIFSHFTCATDTKSVRFILNTVMQRIITDYLEHLGLQ